MMLQCYLHILFHLYAMKMPFLKLFLICRFKNLNLSKNLTEKKISSMAFMKFVFSMSGFFLWFLRNI